MTFATSGQFVVIFKGQKLHANTSALIGLSGLNRKRYQNQMKVNYKLSLVCLILNTQCTHTCIGMVLTQVSLRMEYVKGQRVKK